MNRAIGLVLVVTLLVTQAPGVSFGAPARSGEGKIRVEPSPELVRVLQDNAVTRLLVEASRRHRPRDAAFVDVNVISVRDGSIREHQTVVVEDGKFTAVGSARDVRIPRGAIRIDGAGKFLLPGLSDMHIHSMVSNSQKILNLANGVTNVREMDGFPYLLEERRAIRENRLLGPNMYVTGTILAALPMEDYARVVASPEEARAPVVEQKLAGYDFIKVHNVLPDELYRAVLDEARRQSIDVVGHIPHDIRLEDAIRLGQRTFEHMKGYYYDTNLEVTKEDYVGLTKGAVVWNCPTFYTRRSGIAREELERLIATSEEMRYVPAVEKRQWVAAANAEPDRVTETIHERSAAIFRELLAVRARFITGTDSGGGYGNHVPGFALQHELETMESLGMPAADVLRASTMEAAAAMRREREFGSIDVGMRADCVLASKNPLETVANLKARKGVMVRGIWLPPETIAEMLAGLEAIYADDERLAGTDAASALNRAVRDARWIRRAGSAALVGRESTLVTLGSLLLDAGMTRDAVEVLGMATKAFPQSAVAHATLAKAHLARGSVRDAAAEVERALSLDPGNDPARRLIESAPLRIPPTFDPAGVFEIETRMLMNGAMKPVSIKLEVTGSPGHYSGRMLSSAAPEFQLEKVSAVGSRLWATAVSGKTRIDFRLVVTGRSTKGSWSAGFGGGSFTGSKDDAAQGPVPAPGR